LYNIIEKEGSCVGYDIDEWSADNTRHNAVINHVDDRLTSLCGDSSVLSGFYEADCALLSSKAQQLGLKLISTRTDGDWASMVFAL
jgi:ribosomal protein L11 methyltransferase